MESENQIQAAFVEWLALHEKKYPELELFYAIPNGSYKSPQARGLFKRTGLKPGVPDCHLPVPTVIKGLQSSGLTVTPNRKYCGLWIEFKSENGRLSAEQKEWGMRLLVQGHKVAVCRSWVEAANITIEYLNLPISKL